MDEQEVTAILDEEARLARVAQVEAARLADKQAEEDRRAYNRVKQQESRERKKQKGFIDESFREQRERALESEASRDNIQRQEREREVFLKGELIGGYQDMVEDDLEIPITAKEYNQFVNVEVEKYLKPLETLKAPIGTSPLTFKYLFRHLSGYELGMWILIFYGLAPKAEMLTDAEERFYERSFNAGKIARREG
jgi:hypothetical protein